MESKIFFPVEISFPISSSISLSNSSSIPKTNSTPSKESAPKWVSKSYSGFLSLESIPRRSEVGS
jgi:hypothetical protein